MSRTRSLWITRAEDGGSAAAMVTLGCMYELGNGVQQDASKAYIWFSWAAALKHKVAIHWLSIHEHRTKAISEKFQ